MTSPACWARARVAVARSQGVRPGAPAERAAASVALVCSAEPAKRAGVDSPRATLPAPAATALVITSPTLGSAPATAPTAMPAAAAAAGPKVE